MLRGPRFIGPGDTLLDSAHPLTSCWMRLLALGLLLAACGGSTSFGEATPHPRVEVGTGREFIALQDGATLELVRGGQGSQHVFVSLRAWELAPLTALVELSLTRTGDGQVVSVPYKVRLPFEAGTGEGAPATVDGILLAVPDPVLALGQELRLTATLQDASGERATDARTVTLEWCTDACP